MVQYINWFNSTIKNYKNIREIQIKETLNIKSIVRAWDNCNNKINSKSKGNKGCINCSVYNLMIYLMLRMFCLGMFFLPIKLLIKCWILKLVIC